MLIVKFKNIQFVRAIVGTNMTGLLYSEALYMDYAMPSYSNRHMRSLEEHLAGRE